MNDSLVVPFGADSDRILSLYLHVIGIAEAGGTTKVLGGDTIEILIDSVVPEIWLPVGLCSGFESAFGLIWNHTYEIYLVTRPNNTVSCRNGSPACNSQSRPPRTRSADLSLIYRMPPSTSRFNIRSQASKTATHHSDISHSNALRTPVNISWDGPSCKARTYSV